MTIHNNLLKDLLITLETSENVNLEKELEKVKENKNLHAKLKDVFDENACNRAWYKRELNKFVNNRAETGKKNNNEERIRELYKHYHNKKDIIDFLQNEIK